MAKIKQNNFLDTVDEVFTSAKNAGVLHLMAEGQNFNGRKIEIEGKSHFHFGTTGYLGLEQDVRLKKAAIAAIEQYGTQFPLSKSYISHPLYARLEEQVREMYGYPIIITKNSTLGHMAVIPTAVRDEDGVILDHQVHWSVQNATQLLKLRGVPVEMIRHNNLEMLEHKVKQMSSTCKKIWYMADGVYSMYGDFAPVEELMELSARYPQLHFYFDDVHGMSWNGRNGTGYVNSILKEIPDHVLLIGTLSKTFGASGAVVVCPDKSLYSKIKTFGGPLTFSAQLEPASVGAAIASTEIHLSPEIYNLQKELKERIDYFNQLLEQTDLPLIDKNSSPVFYVGTGMPITGYNFVRRLLKEGFYVNLGIFPAVPVKNTGVRITISRHNKKEEIKGLVDAMVHHFPRSLEEIGTNLNKVRKAFKLPEQKEFEQEENNEFTVEIRNSIKEVDKEEWNKMFGGRGVMDWNGQSFMERVFTNNPDREHNWQFYYLIIRDQAGLPILATALTNSLWKDDLLAPASTSLKVEEERSKTDKYYLTSYTLSTGSLFTEGEHLFVKEDHPEKFKAIKTFLKIVEELEDKDERTKLVVLRDFEEENEYNSLFHDRGFVKVRMPESCYFEAFDWKDKDDFPNILSKRSRRHLYKDIVPFEENFIVEVVKSPTSEVVDQFVELYENVRKNNPGLNTFPFPGKLFQEMRQDPSWEFISLYLKKDNAGDSPVGVMFCYENCEKTYVPSFVGMDYRFAHEYNTYRQLLYQTILRAHELELNRIDFGLTASFEKRKLGAVVVPKVSYIQTKDNFSLELLETMSNSKK